MSRSIWISASLACLVIGAGFLFAENRTDAATKKPAPAPAPPAAPAIPTVRIVWPTPYPYFKNKADDLAYLQATVSGKPESGGYGMIRNGGARFHEGIDIRPMTRDRKGEPADPVCAALSGRIAYLNTKPNGAYGRYIVLEHNLGGLVLYTLYGHLAAIDSGLREGRAIEAGNTLGLMGRSDGSGGFPKERAHLHFEVGLRLSDHFGSWYLAQRYPDPNLHGNYNGINLAGLDPVAFFRFARANDATPRIPEVVAWVKSQAVAVTVDTPGRGAADMVRRNPALVTGKISPASAQGWRVGFTAEGVPVSWEPLAQNPGTARIVIVDNEQSREARRRGLIVTAPGKTNRYTSGSTLETALELTL